MRLTARQRQALGLDDSALVAEGSHRLLAPVQAAFERLAAAAAAAGFRLEIASAYRSFERQQLIWNRKLRGERAVLDDNDCPVDLSQLAPQDCVHRILRFSALPGASRHHWGTDLDVFDAAAVAPDYPLQLSQAEVSSGGPFAALHAWLDEQIAAGTSHGFYRPYDQDRGGVAPERWHLSFAPLAQNFECEINADTLRRAWREEPLARDLQWREFVAALLEELLERYAQRVAAPPEAALHYSGES